MERLSQKLGPEEWTIKALVTLCTEWKKPAEAAAFTARLKPVPPKP